MGETAHGNDNANPFASLAIWRDKVVGDLQEPPQSADYKQWVLLLHGKDCEQAVWGCLKDALSELREGQEWELLSPDFAQTQHTHIYNVAAQELLNNKTFILELAHEHGVAESYSAAVKRPLQHTIADYERIGELRFGLLVWRANLQRDLSVASDGSEAEKQLRDGYHAALELIRRCIDNSAAFWAAQQAHGAPTAQHKRTVWEAAVAKTQRSLREIAEQHHVSKDTLHGLF